MASWLQRIDGTIAQDASFLDFLLRVTVEQALGWDSSRNCAVCPSSRDIAARAAALDAAVEIGHYRDFGRS